MSSYITGLVIGAIACFIFSYGMKTYTITSENIRTFEEICSKNDGANRIEVHSRDFTTNITAICGNGVRMSLGE